MNINNDDDDLQSANCIVTGIDLCRVDRIRKIVERHGDIFLERVYTSAERDYCLNKISWARHFAARFAAKEAVAKMLGSGVTMAGFLNVEVVNKTSGKPKLVLRGRAKEIAESLGVSSVDISITHEKEYAVAIAVGIIQRLGC
ncbi:MAG TPA: holo-ACP synthase [Nitrospinota bacterium]|jgi:holo-[acyl-carrier protein] synthase|nr:holo-ACP synthase [Nitrospinota bacterium]|tara:strand:- start:244004 stop:244432 length:429 start_codon:yes stop_codon:yes gene_type:complete